MHQKHPPAKIAVSSLAAHASEKASITITPVSKTTHALFVTIFLILPGVSAFRIRWNNEKDMKNKVHKHDGGI
jgi:predicted transporter